jgi:hypothetical protein
VSEVTLAPAVARQPAEPVGGVLEWYHWLFGQHGGAAIVSLLDSQATRLQGTLGPAGR